VRGASSTDFTSVSTEPTLHGTVPTPRRGTWTTATATLALLTLGSETFMCSSRIDTFYFGLAAVTRWSWADAPTATVKAARTVSPY
jgi:hypothetical protein